MNLLPAISPGLPGGAADFLGSIARALVPASTAAPLSASASTAAQGAFTLTPEALRHALLDLGMTVTAANLSLAEAVTNLGLPLTVAMLSEARTALARAPGADPAAFALAKSLALPTTPGILSALSAVTRGIPASKALPAELMEWLSFAARADSDPDSLAAQLHIMVGQRMQSVEGRLTRGNDQAAAQHARTLLLRLAEGTSDPQIKAGTDTLAAHMEGQQLINQSAQLPAGREQAAPLYFAVPILFPGEQTMLEVAVQPWDAQKEPEAGEDDAYLQATVRLATTRLGRVQAILAGTLAGRLTCSLAAERPATLRLLRRGESSLAAAFGAQGWLHPAVSCTTTADWQPLWQGGAALAAPRARVDWIA